MQGSRVAVLLRSCAGAHGASSSAACGTQTKFPLHSLYRCRQLTCLCVFGLSASDHAVGGRAKIAVSARKSERTAAAAPLGLKMEEDPLLLRVARGEKVERTPVWMMRQAGRHMQCYRDLVKQYPTFRERSEIPEVSTEISLQPFEAYGVDGCILFSDILTPLPGMGNHSSPSVSSRICVREFRAWSSGRNQRRMIRCS